MDKKLSKITTTLDVLFITAGFSVTYYALDNFELGYVYVASYLLSTWILCK